MCPCPKLCKKKRWFVVNQSHRDLEESQEIFGETRIRRATDIQFHELKEAQIIIKFWLERNKKNYSFLVKDLKLEDLSFKNNCRDW